MDKNYTPVDVVSLQKKYEIKKKTTSENFDINVIFLGLIAITLIILATLLFILIQKKLQELAYIPFFA